MKWQLLEGLPETEVQNIIGAARRRSFRRGVVIFHEHDPGESLHLIEKGRVAVRVTTPMGDEVTFEVLGTGDVFGEMALLEEKALRNATVVALEETHTISIDRSAFEAVRRNHPAIERVLLRILAERVQRLSTHLVEALYVPADLRVLRRLLDLTKIYGASSEGMTIPLTQEELAELAGTSRVTVNRVLREEERKGNVKVARGTTRIISSEAIRARAYSGM